MKSLAFCPTKGRLTLALRCENEIFRTNSHFVSDFAQEPDDHHNKTLLNLKFRFQRVASMTFRNASISHEIHSIFASDMSLKNCIPY